MDFSGFEVDYEGELLVNDCHPNRQLTLRILLLLWTGDHLAQCEICKSKSAGAKNACRRCKLKGNTS